MGGSMLTKEQLDERKGYITGSDASVVMGVNPYSSLYDVWELKLGLKEPEDITENPRVAAGNYLESGILRMFQDRTGKEVIKPEKISIHSEHKWMAGNLDGWIESERAVVEIKTSSSYVKGWGEQGVNIIPAHYACQVAHYMSVMDAAYAYVVVMIDGWDYRTYKIERSQKFEEVLIKKEREFFDECVVGLKPPAPRCYDDIVSLYRNKSIEDAIICNENMERVINALKEYKQRAKEIEEKEKQLKNDISLFMKGHEVAKSLNNEVLATFKYAKDGEKFDSKAFAKDHPDLYKEFLVKVPGSRRLLIKGD